MTVALPQVIYDAWPGDPEYAVLWDTPETTDPRLLTLADFAVPANDGECWSGTVDVYPSTSGAAFHYCPANALAGRAEIDDPAFAAEGWIAEGDPVPDYTGEDRLYIAQEATPYPLVRADS